MSIELLHIDCMEYMKDQPDNAFDLAIVDPPYGIGMDSNRASMDSKNQYGHMFRKKKYDDSKQWDNKPPSMEYFEQLSRVARNKIIWGANNYGIPFRRFVYWHKRGKSSESNYAEGEIASVSCGSTKQIDIWWNGLGSTPQKSMEHRIHPAQKPVKLYKWLLTNYAEPGQRILDTHLGSGSSAIAAHYFGCDFVGTEIDEDYYKAAVNRFEHETAQMALL